MNSRTPICDFVRDYASRQGVRMHMPGHKGKSFLGCEALDITEICGADELYAPEGIILRSEEIASELFGSQHTYFGTEGSSQCVKAMLAIAAQSSRGRCTILAARNVHSSFISGCALLDIDVRWLYPEDGSGSICSCMVSPEAVRSQLEDMDSRPSAVYLTSPDYLGGRQDIAGIAAVCREYGIPLLVDNAHGAYLRFLERNEHPLALGATMCCDSAHKTLPVLTGGAYLHIARGADIPMHRVRSAMAMFGSTSPSYLILQSLDRCNEYLFSGYRERLRACIEQVSRCKDTCRRAGWQVPGSDPLRITLRCDGKVVSQRLREKGIECEFADADHVVLMLTCETQASELEALTQALGDSAQESVCGDIPHLRAERCMSIREAVLSASEIIPVQEAQGRVCAAPLISCPPAVPIAVSGERITAQHIELLLRYGNTHIAVVHDV
ncbi:MAG: amino acid decarboxylase [Clostridia bacterium]|nr:amino acid decarboxylase [Clostridia bacterium]